MLLTITLFEKGSENRQTATQSLFTINVHYLTFLLYVPTLFNRVLASVAQKVKVKLDFFKYLKNILFKILQLELEFPLFTFLL